MAGNPIRAVSGLITRYTNKQKALQDQRAKLQDAFETAASRMAQYATQGQLDKPANRPFWKQLVGEWKAEMRSIKTQQARLAKKLTATETSLEKQTEKRYDILVDQFLMRRRNIDRGARQALVVEYPDWQERFVAARDLLAERLNLNRDANRRVDFRLQGYTSQTAVPKVDWVERNGELVGAMVRNGGKRFTVVGRETRSIERLAGLDIAVGDDAWETFMEVIRGQRDDGCETLVKWIGNVISSIDFVVIAKVGEAQAPVQLPPGQRLARLGPDMAPLLSSPHIAIIMEQGENGSVQFKRKETTLPSILERADELNNGCWPMALMQSLGPSYNKVYKTTKPRMRDGKVCGQMNVEYFKMLGLEWEKEGLTFNEIAEKVFTNINVNGTLLDHAGTKTKCITLAEHKTDAPSHKYASHFFGILHNNHVWTVDTDQIRSLAHVQSCPKLPAPSSVYTGPKFRVDRTAIIQSLDEMEEHLERLVKATNQKIRFLYCGDVQQLFFDFQNRFDFLVTPKVDGVDISGFKFKANNCSFSVDSFVVDVSGEDKTPSIEPQHYESVTQHLSTLAREMFTSSPLYHMRSSFSPSVQATLLHYNKANLVGAFVPDAVSWEGKAHKVDMVRAYTSYLKNIENWMVFTSFDHMQTYKDEPIEDGNLYVIENIAHTTESWILCNTQYNLITGIVLRESGMQKAFRIHAWARPAHLQSNTKMPEAIQRMYEDPNLPPSFVKLNPNMIVGLATKRNAQNSEAIWTTDLQEAATCTSYHAVEQGGWVGVRKSDRVALTEGYYPIGFQIYDRMRLDMLHLYRKTVRSGAVPLAIRVDCLYVDRKPELSYVKKKTFETLGGWGYDGLAASLPTNMWHITRNEMLPVVDVPNGFMDTPLGNIMHRTFVTGDVPGAAKSSTVIPMMPKKATIVVVPTNEQAQEVEGKYGVKAITIAALLDQRLDNAGNMSQGEHVDSHIKGITHIVFDELPQCGLNTTFIRLLRWIEKHKDLFIVAIGDFMQTELPSQFSNAGKTSRYMERCLSEVFPNRLVMKGSKRLVSESDRSKIYEIKRDLFELRLKKEELVAKYGFKTFDKLEDMRRLGISKALSYTQQTSAVVNNSMRSEDEVGSHVVCRFYDQKKKLNYNASYVVEEVVNLSGVTHFRINGNTYPKRNFVPDFSRTTHAAQGATWNNPYAIFDWQMGIADRNWLWVALTRCRRFSDVHFYVGPPLSSTEWGIDKKLAGYVEQDAAAGRSNNMDASWIRETAKKQNYQCFFCGNKMTMFGYEAHGQEQWTVDRRDNKLGHLKHNCVLSCLHCNVSHK
jgi:hypothetical protein